MSRSAASPGARGATAKGARGFALLEVLITLGISLFALSALLRLQGELFRGDTQARARTQAVLLAEQRLEMLYGGISVAGTDAASDGMDAWTAALEPAEADMTPMYTRAWSVDDSGETARIEIRVTWSDHAGVARGLDLATLVDPVADNYGAAAWTAAGYIGLE